MNSFVSWHSILGKPCSSNLLFVLLSPRSMVRPSLQISLQLVAMAIVWMNIGEDVRCERSRAPGGAECDGKTD
eukprot:1228005-Pyramimonas_sp.AAC.1